MKIDPMRSLLPIDELIERTTNTRHRAMLQNFRTHIIAEVTGDLETIMATLVPEPTYHTYSPGSPLTGPVGQQQTRAFYQNMFDHGYNVLEKEIDRLYVCDDYVFNDGWMYTVFPVQSSPRAACPSIRVRRTCTPIAPRQCCPTWAKATTS